MHEIFITGQKANNNEPMEENQIPGKGCKHDLTSSIGLHNFLYKIRKKNNRQLFYFNNDRKVDKGLWQPLYVWGVRLEQVTCYKSTKQC